MCVNKLVCGKEISYKEALEFLLLFQCLCHHYDVEELISSLLDGGATMREVVILILLMEIPQ